MLAHNSKLYFIMAKKSWQELEATSHSTIVTRENTYMLSLSLLVPLLLSLESQPVEWCHPLLYWILHQLM